MAISSMNGSGKTLCMLVPAINAIDNSLPTSTVNDKKKKVRLPQALMVLPTVGLVEQTSSYLRKFNKTLATYKEDF
jgi:superfamily II DNA/RNA helicase